MSGISGAPRRLLLLDGVDSESIVATYEGGVVTVRVPMP